jgi:hypothetical protein
MRGFIEWWIGNDFDRGSRDVFQGAVLVSVWRNYRKQETWLGWPVTQKNRLTRLLKKSLERYRHATLLEDIDASDNYGSYKRRNEMSLSPHRLMRDCAQDMWLLIPSTGLPKPKQTASWLESASERAYVDLTEYRTHWQRAFRSNSRSYRPIYIYILYQTICGTHRIVFWRRLKHCKFALYSVR